MKHEIWMALIQAAVEIILALIEKLL